MDEAFFRKPPLWVERINQTANREGRALLSRTPFWNTPGLGVDWRTTIRSWARAGQMTLTVKPRKNFLKPSRLVVLWDVSGSMIDYFDLYLPWLFGLVQYRPNTGVFAFATALQDITMALTESYSDMTSQLAQLRGLFTGGTQIGENLQNWIEKYGEQWLRPPSKVIVISDGWDKGSPRHVDSALRHIRKKGIGIVWVNPLAATPGFAPRTQTLKAALPYLDEFKPGHTPKSLLELL